MKRFAIFFIFLSLQSFSVDISPKMSIEDFLSASSVEDIVKKYPNLQKASSFKHFEILKDHQNIIKAILGEDLGALSKFFKSEIDLEIGEIFYEKFRMNQKEIAAFKAKKSLIYRFLFDQEKIMHAFPKYVTVSGTRLFPVIYYLKNGSFDFATEAILTFGVQNKVVINMGNGPYLGDHFITIRTDCNERKCKISGFLTHGTYPKEYEAITGSPDPR